MTEVWDGGAQVDDKRLSVEQLRKEGGLMKRDHRMDRMEELILYVQDVICDVRRSKGARYMDSSARGGQNPTLCRAIFFVKCTGAGGH